MSIHFIDYVWGAATQTHGHTFIPPFFILYVLVGFLVHSSCLVNIFFSRRTFSTLFSRSLNRFKITNDH